MDSQIDTPVPVRQPFGRLERAALWIGGSALFGSLALVLWNRRALKTTHEAAEVRGKPVHPRDDDGIY